MVVPALSVFPMLWASACHHLIVPWTGSWSLISTTKICLLFQATLSASPPPRSFGQATITALVPPPICGLSCLRYPSPLPRYSPVRVLDLGSGASLDVLSTNHRGAVLLLRWDNFRLLLPMGMDFEALENIQRTSSMRSISALLLAEFWLRTPQST